MLDNYKFLPSRNDAIKKIGLKPDQKLLLLFPASRSQELKYILDIDPTNTKAQTKLEELQDPR